MSEAEYDLAEILRSPLQPDPEQHGPRRWPALAVVFVLSAAAAAILVAGSPQAAEEVPVATVPGEDGGTATSIIVAELTPFPAGYTPISNDVAIHAEAPVVTGDRLLVPVTMVVRRNVAPADVLRPLGGRWELRSDGDVVESRRLVFDPSLPSVFSVEFPASEGAGDGVLTLVERWDGTEARTSIELPWPGEPYVSEEAIEFELGGGPVLRLIELELGNLLGYARWELEGASLGLVEVGMDLLLEDGSVLGAYAQSSQTLDPEPMAGHLDFFWRPGFRVDQNQATTLRLTARVVVGSMVPTEIEIPLPG